MRLNEFDDSLSRADLDNLEVFADKVFGKVGIDVNFTRHFLDRVNDERNIKQITKGELTRLFKQEAKRWAKPIARLGPDAEGTMKDLQTQINLPFVLVWDHNNQELDLIAKTVMRKKDFKTHNTEFPVESVVSEWDEKAWNARYNPDGKTYGGSQNKMPTLQPDPVDGAEDYDELDQDYEGSQMDDYAQAQLKKQLADVVSGLTKREQLVVTLRFGLNGDEPKTLEEIGKIYKVSRGRIRQIEAKALRKLRHPMRTDHLRPHLEESKLNEGDSAPGAGAIHHSEIAPTLQKLEQKLGIPLMKNALGSVGKKEFSGDIDIAVQLTKEEQDDFQAKLQSTPGLTFVQKTGVFITSADIVGYDDSKQADGKQRTGKVQIDFMPGDIEFMKHYYHSPHSKDMSQDGRSSNYKGVHRNLMVSAMIDKIDVNSSDETTPDGRPLEIERWMFSPTQGMVRVIRRPVEKKNGTGYTKANTNEVIKGPFKNPSDWAKILKLDNADDLYSFESLYAAAKKNYPSDLVQKVVSDFKSNPTIVKQGIPDEVKDDVK